MSCLTSSDEVLKKSTEIINVSMNFTELLDDGVTILTAEVDINPTDVTVSAITIEAGIVYFVIAGGTSGTNYTVEVLITTSDNQTLIGEGPLKVRDR